MCEGRKVCVSKSMYVYVCMCLRKEEGVRTVSVHCLNTLETTINELYCGLQNNSYKRGGLNAWP